MAIYTQRHQIVDAAAAGRLAELAAMIADCKAGEIARAAEAEEPFDGAAFDAWVVVALHAALNRAVQEYIYGKYDQGTQASFLSLHADPATPAQAKTAIESVWAWIRSVMTYYYQRKNAITAGTATTWNFQTFNATDPDVQLGAIITG